MEHFNAENIIDYYLTSYHFKDGTTTENWELISKILTSQYCDKPGNENKISIYWLENILVKFQYPRQLPVTNHNKL